MGGIKTIDFHRNGEFQVLFNTAKALHLLNRNGREMKNFPVKLKSVATNEVSVCDYVDTKEYRFLLACKDRKVYNFDKTGKTISGWQIPITNQVVTLPVLHYLSGKKDYIVIPDEDNINFLDRQGKQRIKMKEKFVRSKNNIFLINNKKGDPVFATTDQNGELIFISSDGSVRRKSFGNYTSNHAFVPIHMKKEAGPDFLFYDQQLLSLFDFTGNLLFSKQIKNFTDNNVRLTMDKTEKYIELCSVSENRCIFFKSDCSIIDTFVPNDYRLLTMGSFYTNSSVNNILGLTPDGLLANFQIEFK